MPLVNVSGQRNSLKGTVLGADDREQFPLAGATVVDPATHRGVVTDSEGNFEWNTTGNSVQLVVSFVGFKPDTLMWIAPFDPVRVVLYPQVLGEVTVTGKQELLMRLPTIATIQIGKAELSRAACCNLSESFETNASVDVAFTDAATGSKQIQLLGLAGKYVQILTENFPNLRGLTQPVGLSYIPGPWMQSIQVSKGAASVVNGFEAMTGQLNVELKKPSDAEYLHLNAFGSGRGRFEANANGLVRLNDKLTASLLVHASGNQLAMDDNHDGFLDEPLGKQLNLMHRWEYKSDRYRFQSGVKLLEEKREGGEARFKGDHPSSEVYGVQLHTRRLEWFAKNGWVFKRPATSVGIITAVQLQQNESFYGLRTYKANQQSAYVNALYQSYWHDTRHQYTAGLSVQADGIDEKVTGIPEALVPGRDEVTPGGFLEYTYSVPHRITFIVGLRTDYSTLFGWMVTPRVHAKVNLTPETILRASAGKGYRTAGLWSDFQTQMASSRQWRITQEVVQEASWNYGVHLTRYVAVGSRELTLQTEFYQTRFLRQLVPDFDRSPREVHWLVAENNSQATVWQVEASMEVVRGLSVLAAMRWNRAFAQTDNIWQRVPFQSRYKGLVTLGYVTPLRKWQFDYTLQLNGGGRLPSTDSNPDAWRGDSRFASYQVMNAQVTRYFRKWNVYAGVENLTNFTQPLPVIDAQNPFGPYFDSTMIWGPLMGRNFYAGIRYQLSR